MLDLQKFFTDFDNLVERLGKRGIKKEQLLTIKEKLILRKQLIEKINNLRHERNKSSKEKGKNIEKGKEIRNEIIHLEEELSNLEEELSNLTNILPNIPALDTPTNQEKNKIIDVVEYQHNIQHNLKSEEILKKLVLINEEKSIPLSGSKFAVYQGFGSQLLHVLINFMRVENNKRGYQLFDTPYLVKSHNLYNTGQFHKFQDNLYKLEENDFYLLPTAEVALVNLYQNQILVENDLPLKICAYSPCFRAERMAAGQENKGLIRLHQFHKVELVKIVKPENSYQELKKLVIDAQNILQKLAISHRVIELCYEELGFSATKTYDIEVWLPVSKKWLEISSCNNCEDFQSRRSQIRLKNGNNKYYPHTLNGSSLAVDRLIMALCEYYYNEKENKLSIPKNLIKYFIVFN